MATCSSNASVSPATGEEVEDPATVVVQQHDRQREPEPAGGEQPADVVGERDVADQQHDRSVVGRGRGAEGGGDRAVDPVRAAVGEHARPVLAGGDELLDVADRHRGGDEQRRLAREPLRERAGDERL